jgi:hypothetical protein
MVPGASPGPHEAAIHIGLPRTGTTTLQTRLFAAHSQINYLGIFKRQKPRWSRQYVLQCRDVVTTDLMNRLMFGDPTTAPAEASRVVWSDIRLCHPGKRTVWSWEGLTADVHEMRARRARLLAEVAKPAKVLVTIRHPVSLLESTYFQILRRNNRGRRLRQVWYQPIDTWLEQHWQGEIAPLLDYARTIDLYCGLFGRDAVHILLYEHLRGDAEAYFRSVCGILGIDEREGTARTAGWRDNEASAALIDTVRRVGGGWLGRLRVRLAVARQLRGTLRPTKGSRMPRIGAAGRAAVAERTRAGNRMLAERFGLDLVRHDYPL